jgi:hypothetical protein
MKKTIVLLFLLLSTQIFANTTKTFVGKLATNVQESDGSSSQFSLITQFGGIRLIVKEEQFIRALYKLSGRVLVVSGEAKEINLDDLDLSTAFASDMFASRMPDPSILPNDPLDEDFPTPFDPDFTDFDDTSVLEVSQYTVLIKQQVLEGKIRSEWNNGDESYFLKIASGEDRKVILLEDDQNDFFELYHEKEVKITGSIAILNDQSQFVVSKIKLK